MTTMHHALAAVTALVCATTTAQAGTLQPMDLVGPSTMYMGVPIAYTLDNGPAAGNGALFVSGAPPTRPLYCPNRLNGDCLDLHEPVYLIDSGPVTDGFSFTPPQLGGYLQATIQAVAIRQGTAYASQTIDIELVPTCLPPASSAPLDGAVDVAVDSDITLAFDYTIADFQTVELTDGLGATVPATVTPTGDLLQITPAAPLQQGTTYDVDVTDLCGTTTTLSFTTASGPVCGDGVVNGSDVCDGAPEISCADVGYREGTVTCASDCLSHDTSACSRPAIVDVAMFGAEEACSLDAEGRIRCAPSHTTINGDVLVDDPGPFVDLAGAEGLICGLRPDDTVTCWSELHGLYTLALPPNTVPAFLPDDGEVISLREVGGTRTWLLAEWGSLPDWFLVPDAIDVDLDLWGTRSGNPQIDVMCLVTPAGALACYQGNPRGGPGVGVFDPNSVTPLGPIPAGDLFVDAAVGGHGTQLCGIRDDGRVRCFDQAGNPAFTRVPARATSLRGFSEQFAVEVTPGDTRLILTGQGFRTNDRIPEGATQVTAYPTPSFFSFACWVLPSGDADCGTASAAWSGGLPPAGDQWVDVHQGGSMNLWIDGLGRVTDTRAAGAPDLTVAPRLTAADGGLCGIDATDELRCTGASHGMAVPPGPWLTWDTGDPYVVGSPFCGIHTDGSLECTSTNSLLDSVPSGSFVSVSTDTDFFTLEPYAVAADTNGALACWGDAAFCTNAPVGTGTGAGFVHVDVNAFSGRALEADGTVWTWSATFPASSAFVPLGETFPTYRGDLGIRADGTIGWWGDAARPVPAGTFHDVVDDVIGIHAEIPGGEADACGVRTDGTLICWYDDGVTVTELPPFPGSYSALASAAAGLVALDDSGAVYVFDSFRPQVPVLEVAASGLSTCWLDETSSLHCKGPAFEQSPPLVTAPTGTFDRLEAEEFGAALSVAYCAIGGSGSTCFGSAGLYPGLGTTDLTAINHWGTGFVCWVEGPTGEVACSGGSVSGFTPNTPPTVQDSLPSLDVASNFGSTCRVRQDGELECWGWPYTVNAPLPTGPFDGVESDQAIFVGLRQDGTLASWDAAQTPLPAPPGTFTAIDGTWGNWCGVRTDGTTTCWSSTASAVREH